jgi:diguanylate cyclase (GGDEF)-like protein
LEDLYFEEQQIYDNAMEYAKKLENGVECEPNSYLKLAKEYGRLLRQIRRATKVHDKTTNSLNTSKIDLQGKVNIDALTGIYNRRFFEESLDKQIDSASISSGELSLLMMDIDFFKKYNDTYGHVEGDNCLKSVASALVQSLSRPTDFLARYGGEEFVIILPNTGEAGAKKIAGNVLMNVSGMKVPHEKNPPTNFVTISIGITTFSPDGNHDKTDYIKCADDALYMSKENGRNRYTFLDFNVYLP